MEKTRRSEDQEMRAVSAKRFFWISYFVLLVLSAIAIALFAELLEHRVMIHMTKEPDPLKYQIVYTLFLLGMFWFLLSSIKNLAKARTLKRFGLPTEATILECIRGRGTSIRVTYTVNGKPYSASGGGARNSQVGDSVNVLYWSESPHEALIDTKVNTSLGPIYLWIMSILGVGGMLGLTLALLISNA